MAKRKVEIRCDICGKSFSTDAVLPADLIRAPVAHLIEQACPTWNDASHICIADLNRFRADYVQQSLETERGELSVLEDQVVESLRQHEILAENPDEEFEEKKSLGQRLADRVASFGGSWTFILLFGAVLVVWIALNSIALLTKPFDPFPFILLNLVLSCLAAIQAPVIMMSQNRQEAKDRLRAEHDYRVNLKAELEIRHLHSKLDLLLTHQWQRLLEIQQLQTDLLEEIASRGSGRS
ncbi:DUF1003 domain-containing protein [Blastopirellula marina]|uniref:DUF1003 domain-containing protein n=1 Tax=Blastopirellula marina DSM 3645 TaxID=314230 RepID=A3ZMY8_9BACT|nr:DUF1003 domain-containing protein [Blastopirellula marina]EAQ82317.1 hypothetical protein DSM3645_01345 [Blastopirellula marina DSM 3645]